MKKVMIVLVSLLLIGGGAVGSYFFLKKQPAEKEEKKTHEQGVWNPYSTEENHHVALPEFLISAVDGSYVVKMLVTLDLKDEEAVYKYEGLTEVPVKVEESGHGSEEEHATPMQTVISSKIGTFMLTVSEETLHNKADLEKQMKTYLNKELALGEDFLKHVYIGNLIIQ